MREKTHMRSHEAPPEPIRMKRAGALGRMSERAVGAAREPKHGLAVGEEQN